MAHSVVGLITLALLLEVVARRALAVTVVVAPPAQLVAPGSRAPNLTRPVQIDSINIATELITRYYLNGTLIQCCFNARPASATLAQH